MRRLWMIVVAVVALGLPTGAAVADPAIPAANPNPIDWTIHATFYGPHGEDIPLREGQHDHGTEAGFGLRHIQDKHFTLPSDYDIGTTTQFGKCTYKSSNQTWTCKWNDGTYDIVVVGASAWTAALTTDGPWASSPPTSLCPA